MPAPMSRWRAPAPRGARSFASISTGCPPARRPRRAGATTENNTIRLGSAQSRAFLAGVRGVTTGAADAVAVVVDASGQLGTVPSTRRVKEDIEDTGAASAALLRMRPVTFRYTQPTADGTKPVQYGLIAEEVAAIFPQLVAHDKDGRPATVFYHVLPALLLNELQGQQRQIEAFAAELAALRRERAASR